MTDEWSEEEIYRRLSEHEEKAREQMNQQTKKNERKDGKAEQDKQTEPRRSSLPRSRLRRDYSMRRTVLAMPTLVLMVIAKPGRSVAKASAVG